MSYGAATNVAFQLLLEPVGFGNTELKTHSHLRSVSVGTLSLSPPIVPAAGPLLESGLSSVRALTMRSDTMVRTVALHMTYVERALAEHPEWVPTYLSRCGHHGGRASWGCSEETYRQQVAR